MTPHATILRRLAGFLLLLLTAAPLAATGFASPAGGACAMCASHCRCRPAGERGGGCRVSAPCAAPEPGVATASPVTRVIVPEPFTLSRPERTLSEPTTSSAARALRMAAVPPDPPPRLPAA